ncbi:MAG: hypothetical protein WDN09_04075 [bacterium]
MDRIISSLGMIAGVIALMAFIPFIIAILSKKAKPSIITWTTWAIVNLLLLKSYYDSGAHNTLWLPITFFTGDVIICLLSLKYGEKIITRFDKICIALTVLNILGIVLFSYDKHAVLALSVITLFVGGLPTVKKSWLRPQNENRLVWSMFTVAAVLNLLSIEDWSRWEIIAHPLYVFLIDVGVATILWIKRHKQPAIVKS